MTDRCTETLRRLSHPMEPIATDVKPVLRELTGIRAVLFDVYGTLLISGSGEVGTTRQAACQQAMARALAAVGIPDAELAEQGMVHFYRAIDDSHAESRRQGIDFPEVDIVAVWQQTLAALAEQDLIDGREIEAVDLRQLAVEYEGRANPCWPMPGLAKCLVGLRDQETVLGIISNAQFYTPVLFEALLGEPLDFWGIKPDVQFYSYRHGRAKPGEALYRLAAEAICQYGFSPENVLYLGNDMLNDILPACGVGFHTALFAGDSRSLRLRADDPCVEGVSPDLIFTDLGQILRCII